MGFVRRHTDVIKSVVVFFAVAAGVFWSLNNEWVIAHIVNPFTAITAGFSAWLFKVGGQNAAVYGQNVKVNDTVVTVASGCNGTEAIGLFCAAIAAVPARWPRRLLGLGLGIAGILLINQFRLVGLILVALVRPDMLFEAHNYVGQTFVIVMGMALWVFWAERYAQIGRARAH